MDSNPVWLDSNPVDYFFILATFAYVVLVNLTRVNKEERETLKKEYLDRMEEPRRDFNPDVLLASELYLLRLIDRLSSAGSCRSLLDFYEAHQLVFPQVSDTHQETLARAILSCEGLFKPFDEAKDDRPILATWKPYAPSSLLLQQLLTMIGQLIESCPLSGWLVEDLIRLQAPFQAILPLLISQDNSYLTKVFLRRWCAVRGNSLEGIFDFHILHQSLDNHPRVGLHALKLIVELFRDDLTFLDIIDLPGVCEDLELMKELLDLPCSKTYRGTLKFFELLMSPVRAIPELLVQRLYDFLLADGSFKVSHVLRQITCSLSEKYWSLYDVVPKLCQLVVNRSFSENQGLNFFGSPMGSGFFDLLLANLPLTRLKEILADYDPRRAFFLQAPTTREALNRILELRPEAYEGFQFTCKLEEVSREDWYEVIMKCETLRRQYGLAFLIGDYSSLKVVKLAREYEDLWLEAFPQLYRKALVAYHQELLSFLEQDQHYASFQITLPEDY